MTDKQLQAMMDKLFEEFSKNISKKQDKITLAKAVQLGMQYQEEKIKDGIDIVFKTLHDKNI